VACSRRKYVMRRAGEKVSECHNRQVRLEQRPRATAQMLSRPPACATRVAVYHREEEAGGEGRGVESR